MSYPRVSDEAETGPVCLNTCSLVPAYLIGGPASLGPEGKGVSLFLDLRLGYRLIVTDSSFGQNKYRKFWCDRRRDGTNNPLVGGLLAYRSRRLLERLFILGAGLGSWSLGMVTGSFRYLPPRNATRYKSSVCIVISIPVYICEVHTGSHRLFSRLITTCNM